MATGVAIRERESPAWRARGFAPGGAVSRGGSHADLRVTQTLSFWPGKIRSGLPPTVDLLAS